MSKETIGKQLPKYVNHDGETRQKTRHLCPNCFFHHTCADLGTSKGIDTAIGCEEYIELKQ